jgi:hypothetical protein
MFDMGDPITLAGIVGAGLAGWFGGKKGGKKGAEDTLNGTAAAVKRIERSVGTLTEKVDHVSDQVTDVRERVAFMEGKVGR